MTDVLEARGLVKAFPSGAGVKRVIRGVDLSLRAGTVAALVGRSGAGKTTLLSVIGGVLTPDEGEVAIDGRRTFGVGASSSDVVQTRLQKIGFLFQTDHLLPFLSSLENVALVSTLQGLRRREARRRALELLQRLDVDHHRDEYPAALSVGEAQRVAIARAMANRPRVLLADEPTAALDADRAETVFDLLRDHARESDAVVLMVTHDDRLIRRADRVLRLRRGRLEEVVAEPVPQGSLPR